jgi:hypothetical protein
VICRWLDWKGRTDETGDEEAREAHEAAEVPFQCLQTMREWGPDDRHASLDACHRGRRCFREPRS